MLKDYQLDISYVNINIDLMSGDDDKVDAAITWLMDRWTKHYPSSDTQNNNNKQYSYYNCN